MLRKVALLLIAFCPVALVFSQKKKEVANPGFTIVTGKVLSQADSLLAKQLYFEALRYKAIDNYQAAASHFNQVLEIDPANSAAMYELATWHYNQNKLDQAEVLARQAVTVQSENKWYWLLLADIYKKTNQLDQLVLVLNELIRLVPDDPDYYFDKANALYLQNKLKESLALYNAIEKQFGSSDKLNAARQILFVKQGKGDKATSELEKAIQAHPSVVQNYLLLSEIYLGEGKKDKALALLQKAKSIEPENALINIALADEYRKQGKNQEAFIELKNAFANPTIGVDTKVRIVLSLLPQFANPVIRAEAHELGSIMTKTHPEEPKAFSVFGDVLFQEQKFDEAAAVYKQALKLNNEVYLIWEQLLRIQMSQGKYDEVIADGEEALTIFPNQAALYMFTAIAYAQKQQNEKAISYLKNAAGLETEDKELMGQIYSSLGDSYHAVKNYPESDKAYEKALQINPDNTYTLNNYAYYLALRDQNLEKAAQLSRRSNELEPANASFEDTYAWVLFKQKKYKEARLWMEKAINHDKNNSGVQAEHYGDILFHLGETELAIQQWKKAKENGEKSEILDKKIREKKYFP